MTTTATLYQATSGRGKAVHLTTDGESRAMRPGWTLCGKQAHHASTHPKDVEVALERVTCKRCTTEAGKATGTAQETAPAEKRELSAKLPDGTVATRTTHRDYSYVIAVKGEDSGTWNAWRWTRDEGTAAGAFREAQRYQIPRDRMALVPVSDPSNR